MRWLSSEHGRQQIEEWVASERAHIVNLDDPLAGSVASLLAGDDAMRGAELAALLQIDHLSKKRFDECSSGEQQLVRIAHVLGENPDALVLIEPFRYLDRFRSEHLSMLLRRLGQLGISVAYTDRSREGGATHAFTVVKSSSEASINVKDVSYRHPLQPAYAVEHVSYRSDGPGLTVCIGTNGSGKSTLLELMAKSLHPLYGKVKLSERPLYLPADPEYGPFPKSLNRRVEQLQAVLASTSSLIVLDEPTVGLSENERDAFVAAIVQKAETARVLCATHDERLIAAAGHVLCMASGAVVFDGTREQYVDRSTLWSLTSSPS
ncbi:ATP-binding cassette domain-containing protein [Exiguobacterium sp. SH3S2]|uniref:ATP-binding cassette domain-containing protein n=1 Tax=unclassified Exiguobacterium TaxID=2644629 RepID=UPI00103D1E23|nr:MULTISPECIES: ATP-binding cassette domain-containing protein [unclassified Exiguobacterium]TCI46336.1 ATP-binding cassette domain-containing protein [Exiguobacterium sp. SH3S3]TCI57063.1 ATP-binding cassette domain-containing protein [Exiguobacterium sp. SH5S13]TCI61977.1 ATP-binding cassette domain-containing protein [Exiguobacterium sp. SH3S2]TCI62760.1 ATP-binding cassette domain-containing protein [Exiguobacterium sp. SH3S1]